MEEFLKLIIKEKLCMKNKKLVLKDGSVFEGISYAADKDFIGELVFNTSMVGYQEIATDPSYKGQIVVMTYPLIGNYGVNADDGESKKCHLVAMVCHEYNDCPSNFRYTQTLSEMFLDSDCGLFGGIDTRELTRIIRDKGSQIGLITDVDRPIEECLKIINDYKEPHDQVSQVSTKRKFVSRGIYAKYHVVCIDFGTKMNIIRKLNEKKCNVTVLPYNATAKDVLDLNPDGLFLSNGPGNPEDNESAIKLVRELKGKLPIFGICLGHQIISLAYGAKTYKLKFGHRGGNHPVKNLDTGHIEITSQNHSYAVLDESLLNTGLRKTHINLLDNTIEGVTDDKNLVFSVQYHPESAAGPEDSEYLFDKFINNMKQFGGKKNA
jgi:carbamoyl-phosphate synthase, small subunit